MGSLALIAFLIFLGFCVPTPPGILYYLLDEWINKKKYAAEREHRRKVNELTDRLHRQGILYEELKKADRGESKYFKRIR